MHDETAPPSLEEQPELMVLLGYFAIFGCAVFVISILIADFIVPDHDWIADTISDLGAGRYEFIVDTGIYAFSASLVSIALLSAHVHMGGKEWSFGLAGLAITGLIVFLVGARNEYGDNDSEGVVIHIYLVYALGLLMALGTWLFAEGAARAGEAYRRVLWALTALWVASAPVFFFLPDSIDGIYERYLGVISMAIVITLALIFIRRGHALR